MVTIGKIIEILAELAPWDLAEEWDRVGLQAGRSDQPVRRLMVALDLSERVVEEGLNRQVDGFVIHHPLIFKPLAQIRTDRPEGSLIARILKHDLAVIAAHTNADIAAQGLNHYLAAAIGLQETKPLEPVPERIFKVVVFIPASHAAKMRETMSAAGAGRIGGYSECSFALQGRGSFRPGADTSPYLGETGRLAEIDEVRLEMQTDRLHLSRVIEAARNNHPYEEPIIDVIQLAEAHRQSSDGLGKIGRLPEPVSIGEFGATVKKILNISSLRLMGDPSRKIQRVALCTGSGGSVLSHAVHQRAELFLTGELHYHDYLKARDAGIAVIEAGHWGTEHIFADLISAFLSNRFASEMLEIVTSASVNAEPFMVI